MKFTQLTALIASTQAFDDTAHPHIFSAQLTEEPKKFVTGF